MRWGEHSDMGSGPRPMSASVALADHFEHAQYRGTSLHIDPEVESGHGGLASGLTSLLCCLRAPKGQESDDRGSRRVRAYHLALI